MATMKGSLIHNVDYFGGKKDQTYVNIVKGGQLGFGPVVVNMDAATPLVYPNAIIIVTHTPNVFNYFPYANDILVSLIEKHAKTVDGISPNMTLGEVDGYTLQNKQPVTMPGVSGYDQLSPTFTFQEVLGNLVYNFFEFWVKILSHPDTGYSQLSSLLRGRDIDPLVFSDFCMDICVIQPDMTLQPKNIIDGFFLTHMWPKSPGGELGVKREVGGDVESKERSVEFAAVLQRNPNTYRAAQMIMKLLNLHKVNYDLALPLTTEIEKRISDTGIRKDIEEIFNEFSEL